MTPVSVSYQTLPQPGERVLALSIKKKNQNVCHGEKSSHGTKALIVVLDKKALSATQKYMQELD